LFFEYSSRGRKRLTPEQILQIEPLIDGQKIKEMTIKMMVCELSEWWSNHWGMLGLLWHLQEIESDHFMFQVLRKFEQDIEQKGFMNFLYDYSGLSDDEKEKYVKRFLGT